MNRNNIGEISKISLLLSEENNKENINQFFIEMLTKSELETLSKRWRILEMLSEGKTQREISKELRVSLCKVTRGSQILKNKKSVVNKYLNV
jgi:TrpR family trp operon transcriptional repressor